MKRNTFLYCIVQLEVAFTDSRSFFYCDMCVYRHMSILKRSSTLQIAYMSLLFVYNKLSSVQS